jgi:hypothetical protein
MIYNQLKVEQERDQIIHDAYQTRETRYNEANKECDDICNSAREEADEKLESILDLGRKRNIYDWTVVKVNMSKLALGSTIRSRRQGVYTEQVHDWLEANCDDDVFVFEHERDDEYLPDDPNQASGAIAPVSTAKPYYGGAHKILVYFENKDEAFKFKLAWG